MIKTYTLQFLFLCVSFHAFSQNNLDADIASVEQKVIEWRHYFHENPELSNREFNTSAKIADHLKSLGLKGAVTTILAMFGIVNI